MKKLMYLGLGLAMLNLTSCKKGENDPGMSLKGRKGRLAGEWTLKSMEATGSETEHTGDGKTKTCNTTSAIVDGVKNGGTNSCYDNQSKASSTVERMYTFEKDGTYTYSSKTTETVTSVGDKIDEPKYEEMTGAGTWSFVSKNKTGEYKNKERVQLNQTSSTWTYYDGIDKEYVTTDGDVYTGDAGGASLLYLDKLSSKELIMSSTSTSTSKVIYDYINNKSYSDVTTNESTSTWEKK